MTINYATKFASKIDERFTQKSYSQAAVNQNYDFTGVDTVKVYSIPTVAMADYTLTGNSRYGTATELQNNVQTMVLKKDRAFTFTIDRRSEQDTMGAMAVGKALARQVDEVVIPEVDVYRYATICASVDPTHVNTAPITKGNAYESVLDGQMKLTDAKAPTEGRIMYVSPNFYKAIKLDDKFIKSGDLSQQTLIKGQIGEIDGLKVVVLPTSYLPTNVEFFITHANATTSPIKLEDYKVHDNPPGINGYLVEGRIRYDAFVLDNQKKAIYVHKKA